MSSWVGVSRIHLWPGALQIEASARGVLRVEGVALHLLEHVVNQQINNKPYQKYLEMFRLIGVRRTINDCGLDSLGRTEGGKRRCQEEK